MKAGARPARPAQRRCTRRLAGALGSSTALALLDEVPGVRLRRTASNLPLRCPRRDSPDLTNLKCAAVSECPVNGLAPYRHPAKPDIRRRGEIARHTECRVSPHSVLAITGTAAISGIHASDVLMCSEQRRAPPSFACNHLSCLPQTSHAKASSKEGVGGSATPQFLQRLAP